MVYLITLVSSKLGISGNRKKRSGRWLKCFIYSPMYSSPQAGGQAFCDGLYRVKHP